jgi:DNA-binding MarR family transcriptional regulator
MALDRDAIRDRLREHYGRHGAVPPLAALADLWGFASKSSAARIVAELIKEGVLAPAPGRRLRPGPAFGGDRAPDPAEVTVDRRSAPDPDAPVRGHDIASRMLHLARSIEAGVARASAREGINAGELMVLDALDRVGPPHSITPTALRRYLRLSLAGVGKRVDRLTALGLVERVPDARDRRSQRVRLSATGRALLDRMISADAREAHIRWAIELSPEERAVMLRVLRRAQQRIDDAEVPG